MKVLTTGAGGFVGPHLIRELTSAGHEVVAVDRSVAGATATPGVRWHKLDLADRVAVYDVMAEEKPDAVIHAAGWSHVGKSWDNPTSVFEGNVINTVSLYQAATELLPAGGLFLYISSADIHGIVPPALLPVTESHAPNPQSPYAVSKYSAEMVLRVLETHGGARLLIARPFNHIGPGQSPSFVCPSFARQIAEIEAGTRDILYHGNLMTRRDFLDVRDVVRAYRLLLEKAPSDKVFIVASGVSHMIESIVLKMFELAGIEPRMKVDPALFRPADIADLRGSARLLMDRTDWRQTIPIEQSLRDLLDEARAHIRLPSS